MDGGWVKVWRKVQNNAVFTDDSLFKCWVYCLLKATHKEIEFMVNGKVVHLMPGQFISGRDSANRDLGWSGKKFDRKMQILEKHQYLTREVTSHYTKNTIINWDIYQGGDYDSDQQSDQRLTSTRPAVDQRLTTNKNIKNNKNIKKDNTYTDEFEIFWKEYPNRQNKKNAFKNWKEVEPSLDEVLNALNAQIAHKQKLIEQGKFCPEWPHPERWIKNRRWEDEIEEQAVDEMDRKFAEIRRATQNVRHTPAT